MNWLKNGPPKFIVVISAVTSGTAGIYLFRELFRGDQFKKDVSCQGKVAIVTGGNSGIGKETARELAKRGAVVFILCKDLISCKKARKEIVFSTKNKYVYARQCDLGCLESVRNFAKEFLRVEKRLDILINNAGVWSVPKGRTEDGFEVHLGVNHMGHFLLTNLLLDLLIKSAPSRIINVTAAVYSKGKINKEDLNSEANYSGRDAYYQSKLANMLFTMELAERLEGTGVTVNAVNPGHTLSGLYRVREANASIYIANLILKPFMWILYKTPAGGAQTSIYAALDPDLENVSGKYFSNCGEAEVDPQAKDKDTAKWLWAVSEKWTRIKGNDEGNVVFS